MTFYLKNKKKIETIFKKGDLVKGKGLLLKAYDFKDGETKFGVSVSKKLFPSAVKRNLIKRRLRQQVKSSGLIEFCSKGVSFFIIYTSKEIVSSKHIKNSLQDLSIKLKGF